MQPANSSLFRKARAIACVLLLSGCISRSDRSVTYHPDEQNSIPDGSLSSHIRSDLSTGVGESAFLARQLATLVPGMSVGQASGDGSLMFSRVTAAAIDRSGDLFVVDRSLGVVRVFDERGSYKTEFGAGGPRGLASPEAIAVYGDGRVAVLDKGTPEAAVKQYRRSGQSYQFVGAIPAEANADDLCQANDELFVRATAPIEADGKLIWRFASDGSQAGSFGRAYKTNNVLVRGRMSAGRIACVPTSRMVIAMSDRLPYVWGYTESGELKWVARFADINLPMIEEGFDAQGGFFHISRQKAFDLPITLVPLTPTTVLVQWASVSGGSDGKLTAIHSFVIDVRTGNGAYSGSALPQVLTARWPQVITLQREPFVHVKEFRHVASGQ